MIVIDYLQLMQSSSRSDNRQQEISEISRSLKGLARELNVPVIIHRLLVKGGADELVARSLESKSACQQGLIQGIKALAEEAHNEQ